jgi:hypothetical protein
MQFQIEQQLKYHLMMFGKCQNNILKYYLQLELDDVKYDVKVGALLLQAAVVIAALLNTKSSGSNLLNPMFYIFFMLLFYL